MTKAHPPRPHAAIDSFEVTSPIFHQRHPLPNVSTRTHARTHTRHPRHPSSLSPTHAHLSLIAESKAPITRPLVRSRLRSHTHHLGSQQKGKQQQQQQQHTYRKTSEDVLAISDLPPHPHPHPSPSFLHLQWHNSKKTTTTKNSHTPQVAHNTTSKARIYKREGDNNTFCHFLPEQNRDRYPNTCPNLRHTFHTLYRNRQATPLYPFLSVHAVSAQTPTHPPTANPPPSLNFLPPPTHPQPPSPFI